MRGGAELRGFGPKGQMDLGVSEVLRFRLRSLLSRRDLLVPGSRTPSRGTEFARCLSALDKYGTSFLAIHRTCLNIREMEA